MIYYISCRVLLNVLYKSPATRVLPDGWGLILQILLIKFQLKLSLLRKLLSLFIKGITNSYRVLEFLDQYIESIEIDTPS